MEVFVLGAGGSGVTTATSSIRAVNSTVLVVGSDFTLTPTFTISMLDRDLSYAVDESLNASSLRRLKELMFIPTEIKLKKSFNNHKKHRIQARNQLKQRIRVNEKPKHENSIN